MQFWPFGQFKLRRTNIWTNSQIDGNFLWGWEHLKDCISCDNKLPQFDIDISDSTCERLREMFVIHFTLWERFGLKKLPQDQLTLLGSQGSFKTERKWIGLVSVPLPCRIPAGCPLWMFAFPYSYITEHLCCTQKDTLVAHLFSAFISKPLRL